MANGPIVVPAGAMGGGTDFASIAFPAVAKGLAGLTAGLKEKEAVGRERAMQDLATLIQLHGPEAVNRPEFGSLYEKMFGRPWPTQEVDVTEFEEQPVEAEIGIQRPEEGGLTQFLAPAGVQKVKVGERQVPITRREERPVPLGGLPDQALLTRPALEALGEETLRQQNVPQNLWSQPLGTLLRTFPGIAQSMFGAKGQLQAQKDEAKFIHDILLGDISRMSPPQLQMALQRYNSLVSTNPEWGMQPVDPGIAKQMIEDSVNYQVAVGRMNLMQAQAARAGAEAESIRTLTPEKVELIRAQVYQIRELTPAQKARLSALAEKALTEAKFMVENKGMTPYQATRLAMDAHFKSIDDQRQLIALYVHAQAARYKVDPIMGAVEVPNMAAIADSIAPLASQSTLMLKTYPTNKGTAVAYMDIIKSIADWRAKGWTDMQIAGALAQLGIPSTDFLFLLPGIKGPGRGPGR